MMNIFFDVDYTILGVDGSLRPGTINAFKNIKGESNGDFGMPL